MSLVVITHCSLPHQERSVTDFIGMLCLLPYICDPYLFLTS